MLSSRSCWHTCSRGRSWLDCRVSFHKRNGAKHCRGLANGPVINVEEILGLGKFSVAHVTNEEWAGMKFGSKFIRFHVVPLSLCSRPSMLGNCFRVRTGFHDRIYHSDGACWNKADNESQILCSRTFLLWGLLSQPEFEWTFLDGVGGELIKGVVDTHLERKGLGAQKITQGNGESQKESSNPSEPCMF